MARKYSIYRITSPSAKCYVGLTGMSVSARWNAHVRKALGTTYSHPFYNAIRKYGAHAFSVEVLQTHLTKVEAQSAERRHISDTPPCLRYNLSPGGERRTQTVLGSLEGGPCAVRGVYVLSHGVAYENHHEENSTGE